MPLSASRNNGTLAQKHLNELDGAYERITRLDSLARSLGCTDHRELLQKIADGEFIVSKASENTSRKSQ